MKVTLFVILALVTSSSVCAVNFVQLNMKPGLWQHENPTAKILEQSLANMPDEVKAIMKSQMKVKNFKPIQTCITKEDIKDPNYYIQKMNRGNCTFDLINSTDSLLDGNLDCSNSDQNSSININLKVISDKEIITKTNMGNAGFPDGNQTVSSTGFWMSDVCPVSLKKQHMKFQKKLKSQDW